MAKLVSITVEVDRAVQAYLGDDLQAVTAGFELWGDFCSEMGLTPKPVEVGEGYVEVTYLGLSTRPGASPDTIKLVTGL
ncbi:hypothetical protein [Brevundimonas pondensis]|uniref:Uncharacterized protein n=1 Tax=Brevundimonas pondensis TaxID=2774189 RepID=A0ABX7SNG6_9CAUL|nr:hypothetical protein [Brevundimonas pondensis]QTC88420.1 hypothetical protein IFE19_03235 [Brevundimonas pondensis]